MQPASDEQVKAVGVDVGSRALHVATLVGHLDRRPSVAATAVYLPEEMNRLLDACVDADRVAIDAPARLSSAVHQSDLVGVSRKFATARCAEIAAGEQLGVWVPWITPTAAMAVPSWMSVGLAAWDVLEDNGHQPMEVYPAGSFWLHERRWPAKKTTATGVRERLAILAAHVDLPPTATFWSHDGVDAVVAAAVAMQGRDHAVSAEHVHGDCDMSVLWFLGPAR